MRMFYFTVSIFSFFIYAFCGALEPKNESEDNSQIKAVTYADFILWVGMDCPSVFDPEKVEDGPKKKNAIINGLKCFEKSAKKGNVFAQETVATHYYSENQFKKSLYWAKECAEQGSSQGMIILWNAYGSGNGVIQDHDECAKWLYLAAASGNQFAKDRIKEVQDKYPNYDDKEIREKAKQWIKDHPKAFFNPD